MEDHWKTKGYVKSKYIHETKQISGRISKNRQYIVLVLVVLIRTNWLFTSSFVTLVYYLLAFAAARLLGQEDGVDARKNPSLGDGDSGQQLVELLVVPDSELKVTRVDPGLLVVPGGVAGELEDLRGEVLHDGSEVDGSSSTNKSGVVSFAKETMDPANGELKASAAGTGFGLGPDFSADSSS